MLTTDYPLAPRPANVDAAIKATFAVLSGLNDAETAAFAVRLATLLAAVWPKGYEADLIEQLQAEGEALGAA